jgi:hypothetical protein
MIIAPIIEVFLEIVPAATLGCFARNFVVKYAFHAEIIGLMMTIEIVNLRVGIYFG